MSANCFSLWGTVRQAPYRDFVPGLYWGSYVPLLFGFDIVSCSAAVSVHWVNILSHSQLSWEDVTGFVALSWCVIDTYNALWSPVFTSVTWSQRILAPCEIRLSETRLTSCAALYFTFTSSIAWTMSYGANIAVAISWTSQQLHGTASNVQPSSSSSSSTILTCAQKRTSSQLSLPHGTVN